MTGVKPVMAFSFDSGFSALLLFAASAFVWLLSPLTRTPVRLNLRFAAVLFAALAAAAFAAALSPDLGGMATAVAALAVSLGSAALGLSGFGHLSRPPPPLAAGLALGMGLMLGLAASLSGRTVLAMGALIPSAAVMLALAFGCLSTAPRQAVLTILGAVSLLGGGMALLDNVLAPALPFFAAGLIGLALASKPPVEQQTKARVAGFVSRPRV
jgi:hypothetical protein